MQRPWDISAYWKLRIHIRFTPRPGTLTSSPDYHLGCRLITGYYIQYEHSTCQAFDGQSYTMVLRMEAARNHALTCQERVSVLSWSGAARPTDARPDGSLEPSKVPTKQQQLHSCRHFVSSYAVRARTVAGETPLTLPFCFVNSRLSHHPSNCTTANCLERIPFDRDHLPPAHYFHVPIHGPPTPCD